MHLGYIWAAKAGRSARRGLRELANGIAPLLTSAPHACRLPRASSPGLEVKAVQEHARCGPSACRSRACVELAPSGICAVRVFVWRRYLGLWLKLKRRSPSLSSRLRRLAAAPEFDHPPPGCVPQWPRLLWGLFWKRPDSGVAWVVGSPIRTSLVMVKKNSIPYG